MMTTAGRPITTAKNESSTPKGPSALKDIQYGSIVDQSDAGTSTSEDELGEEAGLPEVIGVSISRAQTRLASPKTPALEKAAALEERGGLFNDVEWSTAGEISQAATGGDSTTISRVHDVHDAMQPYPGSVPAPQPGENHQQGQTSPPLKVPSPWRAGPKKFQHSESAAGILREGFDKGRRERASSGPDSRMKLPFGLPSLPKGVALFGYGVDDDSADVTTKKEGLEKVKNQNGTPQADGPINWARQSWGDLFTAPSKAQRTISRDDSTPTVVTKTHQAEYSTLRRMKSDDSLLLQRTLSRASSLGDDSRFESVNTMVNSRLKAIKDSLQDTNFKLSMPKAPSIFNSSRSDLAQSGNPQRSSTMLVRSFQSSHRDSSTGDLSSSPEPRSRAIYPAVISTSKPKDRVNGMTAASAAAHPYFAQALEDLAGDLVILGGYRGSILREAKAPNRRVWVPIKVGLNLRKVDLEVGLDEEDEENMPENIIPSGMLTHIGPVDMARRLLKRLRASENAQTGKLRVHEYSYDWRLSPHRLSRQLIQFLEQLPCNSPDTPPNEQGATVIAHSLGGLITRYAVNKRPELFAGVVYAGTPTSCVNILGPLRNGDDVLLSSRVLTAQVNFSIRTSFALLPLDGRCFIDKTTKEEYPVDFFNINDWIEHRWSPCVSPPLPPIILPSQGRISSLMGSVSGAFPDSMSNMMPSLPFTNRRNSQSKKNSEMKDVKDHSSSTLQCDKAVSHAEGGGPSKSGIAPQMGGGHQHNPAEYGQPQSTSVKTTVTIPREKAIEYLTRTLADIKDFKENLDYIPSHAEQNLYPPHAVIYGKSEPTVYGARVHGRDGIKRADAYDDLAFASGDGVVLARAAMLPHGYKAMKGGVVASERGHVTLLGDLEAVGRVLTAVMAGRKLGIGAGNKR